MMADLTGRCSHPKRGLRNRVTHRKESSGEGGTGLQTLDLHSHAAVVETKVQLFCTTQGKGRFLQRGATFPHPHLSLGSSITLTEADTLVGNRGSGYGHWVIRRNDSFPVCACPFKAPLSPEVAPGSVSYNKKNLSGTIGGTAHGWLGPDRVSGGAGQA